MSSNPSPRLLLQQVGVISAFLLGATKSLIPRSAQSVDHGEIVETRKAPSLALQQAYADWARARPGRYATMIPWHLVGCQIALPMISTLTARSPYPLLGVLNQGISLRLHRPLSTHEDISLRGRLVEASDDGFRARIHSRLHIGNIGQPEAITLDSYASVVLAKRPEGGSSAPDKTRFVTIGQWQAAWNEGRKFFYLTGDFNPIHTLPIFARQTRFKGCIMHGFGGFAQIFECVQNAGWTIAEIDVKFVRPLPLPSPELQIQVGDSADAQGRYAVRLIDNANTLYHIGSFLPAGPKQS